MLRNYITIAFRNLIKHKIFSLINIFGLSIGITCCVLLSLYIQDEFAYETHFDRYKDIYRLTSTIAAERGSEKMPRTSPPIVMTLARELPEIESATRVVSPPEVEQHLLRIGDKTFYEKTGYLVDSTFFDLFSYSFREGDRRSALDAKSSVVLSDALATKIFRDQSALDQLIIINSGQTTDTFRVTGVLKPHLGKSQLDADFYMNMNSKGWGEYINSVTTWGGQNFIYSFIKLKPGASVAGVQQKFQALLDKYGAKDLKEMGIKKTMGLQSLQDIHLYSVREFVGTLSGYGFSDLGTSGNITYVYVLGFICLFILLIACINFMNLTTAKASQRAGEVGVRKSLGAHRGNLIGQFLGESMTIVLVAMLLSLGLVQVVLPIFNQFTQKELSVNTENMGYLAAALLAISLFTGVVAGSYPAFFLSSFQPAKVLKDKRLSGNSSNWLRKGLVVFQFMITITLISSIIIIQKQMNFVQNKSLGFNPDYTIMLPLRTVEARTNYVRLKTRIKELTGVREVSGSTAPPSMPTMRDIPLYTQGSNMENAQLHFNVNVDENYFKLLDIKFIAGHDLTFEKDTFSFESPMIHPILVNRESLHKTGIPLETAAGTHLFIDYQGKHLDFEIKGVVEDFHQFSLHQRVTPIMFFIPQRRNDFAQLCASVEARDYKNVLANMERAWKEIVPNTPFEHGLLSDSVKRQYEADERTLSIISTFTLIAILISCLGLYGLSIYVAERRVKEIGIRKVLGASVAGIVGMLSRDFIILVGIAFLISVPLGYYAMNQWLEGFAYKTELDGTVFLLAGLGSFGIAWFTVGFESMKAAMGNPVDSLRNE